MQFIHTTTHEEITLAQLKERFPLTLFPVDFQGDFEDYAPIHPEAQPAHDASTHKAVKAAPVEVDGQWRQAWEVVELSAGEIAAVQAELISQRPRSCSPAQGLVALYAIKQITESDVIAAIAAIPEPVTRYTAQIAFSRAAEWRRDSASFQQLAGLLGLTEADLDALFGFAVTIAV